MHTIDILDRICPEEAGLPPSARTWARLTAIQGGFSVLEIRDPNDGPGDPAASTRHQYLIWPPDGDEPHLWRRRLPPAPLDAPPVKQIVYCGGRDAWADADRAAAWELVEPSATSLPWAWATAQGVRTYSVVPMRAIGQWDIHGTGDVEMDGYVMPPRDPFNIWAAVTGAPCPAEGCTQELVWHEAGYVPGYRVCMARAGGDYEPASLRHRWVWRDGVLVRDTAYRDEEES